MGGAGALPCWPALGSPPDCEGKERVTNRGSSLDSDTPQPSRDPSPEVTPLPLCALEVGGCQGASPGVTGAVTWVPLARTRVFRPPLLRALIFPAPGSSYLLGV